MMENQNRPEKRPYQHDSVDAVRKRNEKRKDRTTGNIQMSGTKDEIEMIQTNITKVKGFLGEGNPNNITNKVFMDTIVRFFLDKNILKEGEQEKQSAEEDIHFADTSYASVNDVNGADEQLFVTSQSAVDRLCDRVHHHSLACGCRVVRTALKMIGHVAMTTLQCDKGHKIMWPSSPYLGDKYLANRRLAHGYFVSGIKLNQYHRVAEAAGIGNLGDDYLKELFTVYKECVAEKVTESTNDALLEEVGSYENLDGIDILTDARHATRKNSRYSDVVCIGAKSHKVLRAEIVSRDDDQHAQRHELVGTKRIYDYLDTADGGTGVHVRVHCHDRNTSVNKWIEDSRPATHSTNDTWHATKNIAKDLKKVCSGTQITKYKLWHPQLSDKAASIKTHIYWSMKNCDGDEDKLQKNIMNILDHYKNNHTNCHSTSRCKTDNPYEPSKEIISDPKAEKMLLDALQKTHIYTHPSDYIHCMDTYFVESFNNTMLQYHDKRTDASLAIDTYTFRTHLSILDWNEHINSRAVTSERQVMDARNPRRVCARRNLKRKAFGFWAELWHIYAERILAAIAV